MPVFRVEPPDVRRFVVAEEVEREMNMPAWRIVIAYDVPREVARPRRRWLYHSPF